MKNRKSIRLKGWDYSSNGYYFVTIDVQNKLKLFGDDKGGHIGPPVQNRIGKMIEYWWKEIPNHFKNVILDQYITMPDHFHGILKINQSVGVDRCVDPNRVRPLGSIMQWFKTMTTNEYLKGVKNNNWPKFNKRLWQRNYFEEIIRNEEQLNQTRKYILDNPIRI